MERREEITRRCRRPSVARVSRGRDRSEPAAVLKSALSGPGHDLPLHRRRRPRRDRSALSLQVRTLRHAQKLRGGRFWTRRQRPPRPVPRDTGRTARGGGGARECCTLRSARLCTVLCAVDEPEQCAPARADVTPSREQLAAGGVALSVNRPRRRHQAAAPLLSTRNRLHIERRSTTTVCR